MAAMVVGAAGLWAFAWARGEGRGPRLAGVGAVSSTTLMVSGLACVGVAYHLVVHSLGITGFRAPWPVALGVAGAAVGLSLAADAIENRR
jgi:hypothetical protein